MSAKRTARHKRPTQNHTRQGVALAVTTVVSAGAVIGGAGAAGAAENPVSQSRGWFLSGSALGVNLDDIVKLHDARAVNTGSPATVTELNPLGATLLNSLDVPLGPVNLLEGNGLLTLGAVNQAAIARSNGSAIGASGAVADSGAIAVGGNNNVPASTAKLDLGGVLGSTLGTGLVGGLVDVDLIVGAISANATQAKGENGKQVGDYRIADLKLELQSPLLSGLLGSLGLGALQGNVDALDNPGGAILGLPELTSLLSGVLPALGIASADVTNLPNLAAIVGATDTTLGSGAVTVNLTNGKITVDVEALLISLGLDLNNLPPNTELVRLILDALSDRVGDLVADELGNLVDRITAAVGDIEVDAVTTLLGVESPLVLGPVVNAAIGDVLDDLLATLLAPVTGAVSGVAGPLLDPLFDALEDLLSIRVNVQNKSGGTFTERALQIRVLPGGDTLATVNLASASVGPGQGLVAGEDEDEDTTDNGTPLPETGAGESAPLAAAALGLMLAGAAATAGANRMGNSPAGAHAGARGRGSSGGGRHARR